MVAELPKARLIPPGAGRYIQDHLDFIAGNDFANFIFPRAIPARFLRSVLQERGRATHLAGIHIRKEISPITSNKAPDATTKMANPTSTHARDANTRPAGSVMIAKLLEFLLEFWCTRQIRLCDSLV